MTRFALPAFAAVLAFGMAFAACGDDDDSARPTPTPTHAAATPAASATAPATSSGTAPAASPTAAASATATPAAGSTAVATTTSVPATFPGNATLVDVRIGRNDGFDRIVFEFKDNLPAARVEYVTNPQACGSGKNVTYPGTAAVSIRFEHAQAHDDNGKLTIPATDVPPQGTTILGATSSCDFEGIVTWIAGIKAKQPFTVTTLANPPRVVVDIRQ